MTRNRILERRNFLSVSTAVSVLSIALAPQAGHAQTVDSVVDVCTGVSLPASEVTNIIAAVNEPVIGEVESILDVLTLGPILA